MADHILLVDDDPLLIDAVRFSLERAGYVVHSAGTGAEALAFFQKQPVDLAVLDVGLPDIDGLRLCRRLQAERPLPVIFLTAHDREMDVILGFERGADDYITKPFSMGEFLVRVAAVLRRARAAAPGRSLERHVVGEVELDLVRHTVTVRGQPVELPPKHFALLQRRRDA